MSQEGWRRRQALAAVSTLLWPGLNQARARTPGDSQQISPAVHAPGESPHVSPTPPDPPPLSLQDLVTLDLSEDGQKRMGVAAWVDGQGPFSFLVDTGSDHSVLSEELAGALKLRPAGAALVQGLAGSQLRPLAWVQRLQVGGRQLDGVALPLLPRQHLGALGIIGLDALSRQSIGIDFHKGTMEVRGSHGFLPEAGSLVVRGKSRFGKLILVDSSVKSTPVYVVLDTGAEDSMGNGALRALLYNRRMALAEPDPRRQVVLMSVTGQTLTGEADEMAELKLGAIGLWKVPIVYAELETFRLFGLDKKPALMLGMNTLRSFAHIAIDFDRHEVRFTLPSGETTTA